MRPNAPGRRLGINLPEPTSSNLHHPLFFSFNGNSLSSDPVLLLGEIWSRRRRLMLTGLYFLAGLIGFVYICWWTYLNDRPGADGLPRLGLLAMKSPADEADAAELKKTPAWKRKRSAAAVAAPSKRRRTGR
jgi:hypothetical protein